MEEGVPYTRIDLDRREKKRKEEEEGREEEDAKRASPCPPLIARRDQRGVSMGERFARHDTGQSREITMERPTETEGMDGKRRGRGRRKMWCGKRG